MVYIPQNHDSLNRKSEIIRDEINNQLKNLVPRKNTYSL